MMSLNLPTHFYELRLSGMMVGTLFIFFTGLCECEHVNYQNNIFDFVRSLEYIFFVFCPVLGILDRFAAQLAVSKIWNPFFYFSWD